MTELQNHGIKDIFIACVDGLTGFPDAIESMNITLRKVLRNHRSFMTDSSVMKVIFPRRRFTLWVFTLDICGAVSFRTNYLTNPCLN